MSIPQSSATVTRELLAREPIFHRAPGGADRRVLESLLEADFVEVGASGRRYTRDHVLDVVERRYADGLDPDHQAWTIDEFRVRAISESTFLVTYLLTFAGRPSRRSTLWSRSTSGWRAAYHQGTACTDVVSSPAPSHT